MLKAIAIVYPGGFVCVSGKRNFIAKTPHKTLIVGLFVEWLSVPSYGSDVGVESDGGSGLGRSKLQRDTGALVWNL